ncbi:MAG: PAS domain S-box protein [Promethearchaeota archaeon]
MQIGPDVRLEIMNNNTLETSKKNLQNLFNSMEDFVFVLDFESKIISVNSIVLKRLKYSKDELIGNSALMVHPPDQREEVATILGEMVDGGREICPIPLQTKDGSLIPVETKVTKGKWGNIDALFGISRDITNHQIYEDFLKKSEEKYRELYENAPTAFFSIGTDKTIKRCNNAALRLLGYSKEELLELKVFDLYADTNDGLKKAEEIFKLFLKGNKIQDEELQMKKKNGKILWVSLSVNPIISDSGKVLESRSIIIDITKRKSAELRLKESEEKYRELYDQARLYKDIFAHDINNILQNIQSSIELSTLYLKNPEKSSTIKELYGIIREQVARGSKLISNVRKLSNLHGSKFIIKPIKIDPLIEQSVKFIHQSFQTRKIDIQFSYSETDYFAFANELLLDVFENILINAVKYNSSIIVKIKIKISREIFEDKKYLRIEFIDNGEGIEEFRKKYIFKRGSKEKSSNGGMGLGLSLVKKTVDRYKGKIWVEDRVKGDYKKGSNFIILIPEAE